MGRPSHGAPAPRTREADVFFANNTSVMVTKRRSPGCSKKDAYPKANLWPCSCIPYWVRRTFFWRPLRPLLPATTPGWPRLWR